MGGIAQAFATNGSVSCTNAQRILPTVAQCRHERQIDTALHRRTSPIQPLLPRFCAHHAPVHEQRCAVTSPMCNEDHLPGRLACQTHRGMEDRWTYYNQVGGYRLKQRLRAEGQTFEVCPNSVLRLGVPEIVVQCPSPGLRLQEANPNPKCRGEVGYNRAPLP